MPPFLHVTRLTTKFCHRREACAVLKIGRECFWQNWHTVFTDPRSPEDRKHGVERKVYEDELAVAVDAGGHPSGKAAVINYRGQMGRL